MSRIEGDGYGPIIWREILAEGWIFFRGYIPKGNYNFDVRNVMQV